MMGPVSTRGWGNIGEDLKVSQPPCYPELDPVSSWRRWGSPSRGGGSGRGSSEPLERQKHVGLRGWEDADGGVTGGSVKEEGVEGGENLVKAAGRKSESLVWYMTATS